MAVETKRLAGIKPRHAEHEDDPREHLMHDPLPRQEMNDLVMEAMHETNFQYWAVVGVLALVVAVCLFGAWGYMIFTGMGVAGTNRPVFWGLFISTFIFWIGISHAGTFVSAILRVFKAEFRRPFTRAAELMTTFGLAAGAIYPLIHLGRVWTFYYMVPYPNQRALWPNFHSPLVWDLVAITTYLLGSTMYLFLPLIPDVAMARDRSSGWRYRLYKVLALGWRGTESEWKHLNAAIKIFAWVIIPVMFSVHTIVSWDMAVSMTPGWHSTIFGPFFIAGAVFSGVSAVSMVLFIIQLSMPKLRYFIRGEHFDALGKLVLVFSFVWAYFYFNEIMVEWYGGEAAHHALMDYIMRGPYSWMWYLMLFCNLAVPMLLWSKRIRRNPWTMFVIAFFINVGMYIERVIIVPITLSRGRFAFDWGDYQPRIEIPIAIGSLALFLLLYALASRVIPLIPVWEVQEGQMAHSLKKVGKAEVPSLAEIE
ncbi:MAG: NrfD/PsrC family molybdoenzyme membrane anchor subunit [Chloroflexota bacterium]